MVTNESRTTKKYTRTSIKSYLWGKIWEPFSTSKQVLRPPNPHVLIENSFDINNEYNTNTHYTHL